MYVPVKQQAIFKIIEDYLRMHCYPPSVRDICELAGFKSPSTAQGYLNRLKDKGLVDWQPGKPRTLKIVR